MAYQPWRNSFPDTIDISAVLLPGRELRIKEIPEMDVDIVCEAIVCEILKKYSRQTPLVFFGHSMGSMLAYDVARRLQCNHQRKLAALLVSGRRSPCLSAISQFHKSSDAELIAEINRFGRMPDVLLEDDEMRNLILPMIRADYCLLETYRLEAPIQLDCPLATFTGKDDADVSPEQIQQWQELSTNKVQHHVLEGDHFYWLVPSVGQQLTALINQYISGINVGAI